MSKRLSVSIIIPVYNEADQIGRCLEAIAAQTFAPDEVIVVDNNSSDGTAALAARFPFVRVLSEKKQGVVHARNCGFNAARGDIIGRIDADTIIAPDWVATVRRIFIATNADAISGSMSYHNAPFATFFDNVDRMLRGYLAWALGSEVALQGASLALRASAWRGAKTLLCNEGGMHEDFDLSIHLRETGHNTAFTPSLKASIAFRQAGSRWRDYLRYVLLNPGTYALHNRRRRVVMYPVIVLALLSYPLLRVLYLGYDETTDSFSFSKLFQSDATSRVNPATFVD